MSAFTRAEVVERERNQGSPYHDCLRSALGYPSIAQAALLEHPLRANGRSTRESLQEFLLAASRMEAIVHSLCSMRLPCLDPEDFLLCMRWGQSNLYVSLPFKSVRDLRDGRQRGG